MSESDEEEGATEVRQITIADRGSKPRSVKVLVAGVPIHGVVDSGADITILGGEMFKRVAAVAKLHKKDFKPPDRTPHNYDRQPFQLDGRVDLEITFMEKTMKTPVYVKMDAPEHLLLSEGVCHQLGIQAYHPAVVAEEPGRKEEGGKPTCRVPTVRVRLVQSVRLLPNQSVLADVELTGETLAESKTPLLLEPYPELEEDLGVQVAEAVVQPSGGGMGKVLLTNCLGFTQKAEQGMGIGTASPVEVMDLTS